MTKNETTPTVSEMLNKLSAHLDMLAGQIFDVEQELGSILEAREQNAKVPIAKFQSLDFTRQSLEDCALLLHVISADPAGNAQLEASRRTMGRKLKLDATRGLLLNKPAHLNKRMSGEIDLF